MDNQKEQVQLGRKKNTSDRKKDSNYNLQPTTRYRFVGWSKRSKDSFK